MMLKWKSPDENSVDFLLKIEEKRQMGKLNEKVGRLYINGRGGQLEEYATIANVNAVKQHDGLIVECAMDQRTRTWHFMRVRDDKSHPNAWSTVMGVERSIRDNIRLEELCGFIEKYALKRAGR